MQTDTNTPKAPQMTDKFTHTLDWNGREWWVTTRKNDEPWSGMPVSTFLAYGGLDYTPAPDVKTTSDRLVAKYAASTDEEVLGAIRFMTRIVRRSNAEINAAIILEVAQAEAKKRGL